MKKHMFMSGDTALFRSPLELSVVAGYDTDKAGIWAFFVNQVMGGVKPERSGCSTWAM